jgi:methanogenic corrinoid protein MtbC1
MVLNIALLNKYGFKISHIDKMNSNELHEKIITLSHAQAQQERKINALIQCMVDLDMEKFEMLLDEHIKQKGIDKTIITLVFPFLEKIGILWLTNHINPAQEHLVSNIIRQKLLVGIEAAFTHFSKNKTVLLFLPEGEHHELGLLYAYYLLKTHGVKVLYLGANVPLKDVEFVANLKNPDSLYTHLTSVGSFNLDKFVNSVYAKLPGFPLTISGQCTLVYKKKLPASISFRKSLHEVWEYVSSI